MLRNSLRPIDALFPRTRQGILATLLAPGDKWWYLSDLARHLDTTPSSLQREIARLVDAGILHTRRDGNRVYFQADADNPIYPELRGLMEKTSGVADVIRELVFDGASRQVTAAFVFGSVANRQEDADSDIDLFIIGRVTTFGLSSKLRRAEARLGRSINAVVFPPDEFARKIAGGDHFLKGVLSKDKLFVIGDERDLAETALGQRGSKARREQTRD